MTRSRTIAIAALSAGLLAGGGVGLTLGAPGVVGAQTTTVEVANPTAPTDRGVQLRQALQPLVDQGTLTASQLEAVLEALEAARPGERVRPGHGGGRHGAKGVPLETVAPLLGATVDEVAAALRNGTSIAVQANRAGVPLQSIVDALVADIGERLTAAVEAGRITQEEADEKLAAAPERITTMLERSGPPMPLHRHGHPGRPQR